MVLSHLCEMAMIEPCHLTWITDTFNVLLANKRIYDGASVNSRKNKFKFIFSTVFFYQNSRKKIFNYFLQRFSQNSRKKIFKFIFSNVFPKTGRKNIFKFIFSNVFLKTAEKINLNLFSPTFFQKQQKK